MDRRGTEFSSWADKAGQLKRDLDQIPSVSWRCPSLGKNVARSKPASSASLHNLSHCQIGSMGVKNQTIVVALAEKIWVE